MSIQTPSPDIVFRKWIDELDSKTLEKLFKQKNIPLQRSNISAAECVKNVEKYILAQIIVKIKPKESKRKIVSYQKLRKIEFYDYETVRDVSIYKSIKEIKCDKCNGSGKIKCKKCNGKGYIKCRKCNGTGKVTCTNCKGTGYVELEIKVRISEKEKRTRTIRVPCPECHGEKTVICPECYGIGLVKCDECNGHGGTECSKCGGTGVLYQYEEGPIIKREGLKSYLIFSSELSEGARKEILEKVKKVDYVPLKSVKELDEKNVAKKLGYINDQVKRVINMTKKKLKDIEKSRAKELKMPIMIYPVILLDIETPKKKRATVIGIGSKDKFVTIQI